MAGRGVSRVARMYARALFELSAAEADATLAELGELAGLLNEQPALANALSSFVFSGEEREKLAGELATASKLRPLLGHLLRLLAAKGRIAQMPGIHEAYRELVDTTKNTVRGTVTTVEPLTPEQTQDLSKAFGRKLGKQVVLEPEVDKEILGGLVVNIQGLTFDGSLKTTIRRLKENLERQSI